MPLPPALVERLKQKGIINKQAEPEEEVIAEDYDEPFAKSSLNAGSKSLVPGCPNKINIYHDCNDFCLKQWGLGEQTPPPNIQRKYQRLLKKYPLPENWQDVWEPGLSRYYFWDTTTDEVSWFPPGSPKFKISLPVPKLKAMIKDQISTGIESGDESSNSSFEDGSIASDSDSNASDDSETSRTKLNKKFSSSSRKNSDLSKSRTKIKSNDLDPMDPASYSESCPRGKWSDGLEKSGEAKSAADTTVSGPIYQIRPCPNPGTILKMQKKS